MDTLSSVPASQKIGYTNLVQEDEWDFQIVPVAAIFFIMFGALVNILFIINVKYIFYF